MGFGIAAAAARCAVAASRAPRRDASLLPLAAARPARGRRIAAAGSLACAVAAITACDAPSPPAATTTAGLPSAAPAALEVAPAPAPAQASAAIVLEGEGLAVRDRATGSVQRIGFATPMAATLTALSAAYGAPDTRGTNPDCPPVPQQFASWEKGLTVWFEADKFVGWSGAVDLKTAKGIGFGSTRAALDAAYQPEVTETSLGTEFLAAGMSGVLESAAPDAAISEIWAGATCVAR